MRLLISETSYSRLGPQIDAHAPQLETLVMDDSGEVALGGQPTSLTQPPPPDIAWINNDSFFSQSRRAFVGALRSAEQFQWVQAGAASLDDLKWAQIARTSARICSSHGQAISITEYGVAGILDHFQSGPEHRAAQVAGEWRRVKYRGIMDTR